jgi:signal recognition particle GTPase
MTATIKHRGKTYTATQAPSGNIVLCAGDYHRSIARDQVGAWAWLGGRGLIRRKIRRLLEKLP